MSPNHAHKLKATRLTKQAALMLVFLGLSTNTKLDAAPVSVPPLPTAATAVKQAPVAANDPGPIHILSPQDAALYRTAFAAQEKDDLKAADNALAQTRDKRLVGVVLADRYMRRAELGDIQKWMTSYAALPEAPELYEQAGHMKGFATAHIPHPTVVAAWAGNNNGRSASAGFHSQLEPDFTSGNRLDAKINTALRHDDPIKAREILTTETQRGSVTPADASEANGHIAAEFFYDGEIERARPLAHSAAATGIPLGLWIDGLAAWKQHDYEAATRSFASLAQAPGLSSWDRAAASYWAYRASKRTNDEVQAKHWLAEAARYPRTFYGYMAVALSGHKASASWQMPELNPRNIDILAQSAMGGRALALVQIGRNDDAENELRHLNPAGRRDLQNAILALAEKAHMPALTMQLAGLATNENGQNYEAALYPVPPWQPASGFKVDRALLYALMRHESQFDPEAISTRGACGLMQIMPSTARLMSNERGKSNDCPDRLFDPATNMEMGQKYVRVLAGQPMIGDNLLLLLAAYNGGPGKLSRWLDSDGRADPLLFIETLPVRETRDYVQQVLMQYWMYRSRMAEPDNAVAQLAHGEWPRYSLHDETRQAAVKFEEVASAEPAKMARSR